MSEDLEGTADNHIHISFQHYATQAGECAHRLVHKGDSLAAILFLQAAAMRFMLSYYNHSS